MRRRPALRSSGVARTVAGLTAAVSWLAGVPAADEPARASESARADGLSTLRVSDGRTGRDVLVYRPETDRDDLPVVYFLHGLPGRAQDVQDQGLVELAERSAREGHPFVLAAPDGSGTAREDHEWADADDGADRLESWLTQAVVPAVEGGHPRRPDQRALVGFSMGGYGALNVGLRHPELFGRLGAASGYFSVDDPDGVFAARDDSRARNSPDRQAALARGRRVVLAEGSRDDDPLIHGEAGRMAALLRAGGAAVTVRLQDAGHDWSVARLMLTELARDLP